MRKRDHYQNTTNESTVTKNQVEQLNNIFDTAPLKTDMKKSLQIYYRDPEVKTTEEIKKYRRQHVRV